MRSAHSVLREFRLSPWRTARQARHRGRLTVGRGIRILGGHRIEMAESGRLAVGTTECGFLGARIGGHLNVQGTLMIEGHVTIASGCQWEVGPGAVVRIGGGTYFSPSTQVVITDGLTLGAGCAIGWDVAFLDDDRHRTIRPDGTSGPRSRPIALGEHVWVGSHAKILKGVQIADGCIVAAHSTVTRSVLVPGCLIAGSPARVIREGVQWD